MSDQHWTEESRALHRTETEANAYGAGMRALIMQRKLVGQFAVSVDQVGPSEWAVILWRSD